MGRCPGEAIADADVTPGKKSSDLASMFEWSRRDFMRLDCSSVSTNTAIRCRINFQKHTRSSKLQH
eukprot:5099100-Amphidinium_carterae.3